MNAEQLSYALSTYHAVLATIFAAVYAPRFVLLRSTGEDAALACYYTCDCPGDLTLAVKSMCTIMILYFAIDLAVMRSSKSVSVLMLIHHAAFGKICMHVRPAR